MAITKAPIALALAAAALLALSGCSGASSAAGSTRGTTDPAVIEEAHSQVEAAYNKLSSPPTTGPVAQKGKNIWVITCSLASPGCGIPTQGIVDAGKELGWNMTVQDGQLNPANYQGLIRQAVAAQADGIITVALSCSLIQGVLKDATAAGIPVVSGPHAFDCDADGGSKEYTAMMQVGDTGDPGQLQHELGELKAWYTIDQTQGNAKIITLSSPEFPNEPPKYEGFNKIITKCAGCSVVADVPISGVDLGNPAVLNQKLATVLQQHPEANMVLSPYDGFLSQVGQTLSTYKAGQTFNVIGGEGYPGTMDMIRDGLVFGAVAQPQEWYGWAAADTMNRVLAGETTFPLQGANLFIVDKNHSLNPAKGSPLQVDFDFKSVYEKVWSGK